MRFLILFFTSLFSSIVFALTSEQESHFAPDYGYESIAYYSYGGQPFCDHSSWNSTMASHVIDIIETTNRDLILEPAVQRYNWSAESVCVSTLHSTDGSYSGTIYRNYVIVGIDGQGPLFLNSPPPEDQYDDWCEAIKPTFITVPDGIQPPSGTPLVWESGGCEFTSSGVWIQEPSGNWSATVLTAEALVVEPVADDPFDITDPPISDGSSKYTPTSDPALDCPFSNFAYDGQTYCYSGSDAPQGEEYADSSIRVNHYDGSYTVTDSSGTSVTYNPDGSPQGTASTSPGSVGPGTSNDGCPPWAPSWMCSGSGDWHGEGSGSGDADVPFETLNPMDNQVSFNSGLATTASCPAPLEINIPMMTTPLQFSYQGFCDFASVIRALVLAAAYLSATFLAYRGLT